MSPRPNSTARGYDWTWVNTRRAYLKAHPICECGCSREATVVHHLDGKGPKGPLGHNPANLQALAKVCHDRLTARERPAGWNRESLRRRPPERHPGAL